MRVVSYHGARCVKITSEITVSSIKVRIDDILHLHIPRDRYVGLHAWQFRDESTFYLEIILNGGTILAEYDRRDMWVSILAELDKLR